MKIRSELANKLRAYADQKQQIGSGKDTFKNTLQVHKERMSIPPSVKLAARHGSAPYQPRKASFAATIPLHHAGRQSRKEVSLGQAQKLAHYAPVIQECSKKYKVPVELICAVILQESGGNAKAVSPAGARGIMQLMPATARRFGVTNSLDPRQNIEGGTQYLRFLMERFKGDYKLVLAGYNAGEANVEKYGNKIPPFAETRNYVPNVLAYADTIYQILHSPVIASATLPPNAKRV